MKGILQKGFGNLAVVNPLIGLEFIDLISESQAFEIIKNIQWKDDKANIYVSKSIPVCKDLLKFKQPYMKLILEALLSESKDLDVFLDTVLELK